MAATASVRRGAFILFEGVDRCGKTTQAKRLVEALNAAGQPATFMRFPGEARHSKGWRKGRVYLRLRRAWQLTLSPGV
jgi:thymidylate kinase